MGCMVIPSQSIRCLTPMPLSDPYSLVYPHWPSLSRVNPDESYTPLLRL